jgi:hypothetical protein
LLLVLAAEGIDDEHPAHAWFVDRYERMRFGMELRRRPGRQAAAPTTSTRA